MGTNNLTLTTFRNWGNRDENSDCHQRRQLSVPRSMYNQQGEGGAMDLPWRLFEDRVRTGPFGLARFPSRPHSPAQIIILEATINNERVLNPTLLSFIHNSPPQIRTEWQLNLPPINPHSPPLTNSQFNIAIKKLKKQTYNSPQPTKNTWKKRGLFSNRNNYAEENEKEKKEEEKQCVICLEYFVNKEEVMVTPCNHMFHDKCVVEWVRRNGRCPVCRFVLCETNYGDGTVNVFYGDDLGLEVLNLVRAMEEAFMWMHLS